MESERAVVDWVDGRARMGKEEKEDTDPKKILKGLISICFTHKKPMLIGQCVHEPLLRSRMGEFKLLCMAILQCIYQYVHSLYIHLQKKKEWVSVVH